MFKFFFSYQKKYVRTAAAIAFLLLINVLLQLPMPLITRYLIDNIIPKKDFSALNLLCLILLTIIFISQLSGYFLNYLIINYKARVHFDLEQSLYLHIQDLPLDYFNRRSPGYILARIGEISSTESIMADTVIFIIKDLITIIVGAVLILSLHLELGLISLIILPFFVLSIKAFHQKLKRVNKELREEGAKYFGKLEVNIKAIEKIKSAAKEETEGQRVSKRLLKVIGLSIKSQKIGFFAGTVSNVTGMVAPFIVLWYGVSEIIRGELSLGTYFAINSFLGYLYQPAKRLTDMGYSLSQAMAGIERIYELFKEAKEVSGGEPIENIDEIVFQDVGFSYNGNDWVLNDLNLKIKRGEKIALVGESGEGKSTLVKMILKFYRPVRGRIYFSGKDSSAIETRNLRKKIAYISQTQHLLEEDLEEKINDEEIKKLLKKFRLGKTVNANDSKIYQKEFSGGEIQKLEIIESLLKEANVLIIDEGTSNIDFNAEKIVLTEIFNKYKDKIIIFIAHRLTTITDFERIVVLSDGHIVEDGSHGDLMKNEGKYFFLWGNQKGDNRQGAVEICSE